MLRFVVGPGDALVPDLAARLPGRGIWLSARGDVIETARRKGAFARAARTRVAVPDDLADLVSTGLQRRIADLVGFARRSGQAVAGFAKVDAWIGAKRCAVLVGASDGSPDERRRLLGGAAREVEVVTPLAASALGAVFSRDHIVLVASAPGRLAGAIVVEAERLRGVLGGRAATGGSSDRQVHERY